MQQVPVSTGPRGLARAIFSDAEFKILQSWLPASPVHSQSYHYMFVPENISSRSVAIPLLVRYIQAAHGGAIQRLRQINGNHLDPRIRAKRDQVFAHYPASCDDTTIKGFLGEVLAGLICELHSPGKKIWRVPGYSFHSHDLLFQELLRRVAGKPPKPSLGRFGDDCIAFCLVKTRSTISRILLCEAKCTADHDAALISDAHGKLSDHPLQASVLWLTHLIEALRVSPDPDASQWVAFIESFRDSQRFDEHFRNDAVSYTHRRRPKKQVSWIGSAWAHTAYRARRHLTAIELHLDHTTSAEFMHFARSTYLAAFP